MSLTVRHLLLSGVAVASALTASLITLPQAAHTLDDAHLRRSQADSVQALSPATSAQRKSLAELRRSLPATLTSEQAEHVLTDLATTHHLTWQSVTAQDPHTSQLSTSVNNVAVTTITLTAQVRGTRDDVLALLSDLPTARPLLAVDHLTMTSPTPSTRDLTLTVTAHAARLAR